ncbi:EAL and HDOD domain-containing protein [Bacillus dakarensis]|uniref:EAL and HDOD domain-containing protein n=1 Tax=Robertmurraya dakarensis TaxID=1926278 RepID=UPI000980B3A1|nr:HDOD domain-containing protein [Bacillus dakarensis]
MKGFVGRQPIFNKDEDIFAYELLYRSNDENIFPNIDGDQATADVIINSFVNIGIEELSNGKPCFINFTENLLQLRVPTYFQPNDIVVEILEDVLPGPEIIKICKELKQLGYKIALDDFIYHDNNPYFSEYLKYADIIKVDVLKTPLKIREKIEFTARMMNIELLAEKVETRSDYELLKKEGYDYFQGYFFSKPVIVSTHDIPTYFLSYIDLIKNLSMTEPNVDVITELIERDLSLSYKLLKLINSPALRPRNKISSIRQAIVLLGFTELQKWVYVLSIRGSLIGKSEMSDEVIRTSLTRARLCESISRLKKNPSSEAGYFMTGMFSLMDSIIGTPMDKIVNSLPLKEEICQALIGHDNQYKQVLDLAIAVEQGKWEIISERCRTFMIDESELFTEYFNALNWSNELILLEKH